MVDLVDSDEIESIVGHKRAPVVHLGRAVSAEQTVYILHSQKCKDSGIDLRECKFSLALDKGIDMVDWEDRQDEPVILIFGRQGRLIGRRLGA